jgi:hypothetical protein
MLYGSSGAPRKGGGNDRAMTFRGVALEAQKSHTATQPAGELIQHSLLRGQILAEVDEIPPQVSVLA